MEKLFEIELLNGKLRGNFVELQDVLMVVLFCGYNGFYYFVFFFMLQKELEKVGFSFVVFNYLYCGILDYGDYFDDLESYEKNCWCMEVEDVVYFINQVKEEIFCKRLEQFFIFGYFMGGFNVGFVVDKLIKSGVILNGLIFLNVMKILDI